MSDAPESPTLEVHEATKRFPGVLALDRVNLQLARGEVVAVIGENGAGKSTLMKILAGVQLLDAGQLLIDGNAVEIKSVQSAMDLGIALIHQELNLADNLDVGANIFLGREPTRLGIIDRGRIERESKKLLKSIGLDVSPRTIVDTLPIGKQQMIEIAKALSINARILIMDEPTSSLSQRETEALFRVVKDLRDRGVSIIYISHRLGEVKELADRVVVLRDGQNAGELSGEEICHDRMVQLMVGRDLSQFYSRIPHEPSDPLLEVKQLVTPTHPEHSVSFSLRQGEIVGIAGLVGAGRTELLETLFGVTPALAGEIKLDGKSVSIQTPSDAIERGFALVPEDRKLSGVVIEMGVRKNIGLAGLWRNRRVAGFLNNARERQDTDEMIKALSIKTPSATQIVQYLSGGNQQKVVLGKWLALKPRILLLDEPTRGIDIGAKHEIYELMERLAKEGLAILFVSSEMEEILGMSDRTIVMHEGRVSGELSREELSEENVMQLATGGTLAPTV
jgi:ribose transport system ATP-binding protein